MDNGMTMTDEQMDEAVALAQKAMARIAKKAKRAAAEARRQEAIAALSSYWAGSISQSVCNDYASGNFVVIQAGE